MSPPRQRTTRWRSASSSSVTDRSSRATAVAHARALHRDQVQAHPGGAPQIALSPPAPDRDGAHGSPEPHGVQRRMVREPAYPPGIRGARAAARRLETRQPSALSHVRVEGARNERAEPGQEGVVTRTQRDGVSPELGSVPRSQQAHRAGETVDLDTLSVAYRDGRSRDPDDGGEPELASDDSCVRQDSSDLRDEPGGNRE